MKKTKPGSGCGPKVPPKTDKNDLNGTKKGTVVKKTK